MRGNSCFSLVFIFVVSVAGLLVPPIAERTK